MSKQSVSKRGKIVQFPGTQPFMYKGRKVCLSVGIIPNATERKRYELDEEKNCCWFIVTAPSFESAINLSSQLADELGVCLEGV